MANTHLGVPVQDLVLLESVGGKPSQDPKEQLIFARNLMDSGDRDAGTGDGYTAPTGKALIITDVDFQYENGKAGGIATLRIFIGGWPATSYLLRAFECTVTLGSTGGGGISSNATTGIVVASGLKIRVDVNGSGATGQLQHVLLRGYLADI